MPICTSHLFLWSNREVASRQCGEYDLGAPCIAGRILFFISYYKEVIGVKQKYTDPKIEIIIFSKEDIIHTSDGGDNAWGEWDE